MCIHSYTHVYTLYIILVFFTKCILSLNTEADFRCKLMASEQEMIYLKTKLKEHQTQNIKHERSQRETARLKSVINTQQHQVIITS